MTPDLLETTSDLLPWKLGAAYREPTGKAVLVSAGGGTSLLRLTGSGEGDGALPWSTQVVVAGKACRGTPRQRVACTTDKRGTGG